MLRGAEQREWAASRHVLRPAVVSADLSVPSLVELEAKYNGVWALIVT